MTQAQQIVSCPQCYVLTFTVQLSRDQSSQVWQHGHKIQNTVLNIRLSRQLPVHNILRLSQQLNHALRISQFILSVITIIPGSFPARSRTLTLALTYRDTCFSSPNYLVLVGVARGSIMERAVTLLFNFKQYF